MSDRRQKSQRELAFPVEQRGEAPEAVGKGTETPMAERDTESPAMTDRLMEEVCERGNAEKALRRVRSNRESGGRRDDR